MDAIADDPPLSEAELAPYLRDGRAWVADDAADHPIAYILVDIIDGWAHIEQVTSTRFTAERASAAHSSSTWNGGPPHATSME